MDLRLLLAFLHLMALAIGLAAVYARGRALRGLRSDAGLPAVFHADNWYGLAAMLWVGTGLWRAFGGVEKGTAHYLENHWFMGKLALFGVVFLLELWPMVMLVRWRMQRKAGRMPDLAKSGTMAWLSFAQLPLLVLMAAMAVAMARGY